MPFDPTQPQAGEEIDAVQLRDQFNGLSDIITEQGIVVSVLETEIATQSARIDSLEARVIALEGAMGGTANNPSSVGTLSEYINDPPTGPQVEAILYVLNQFITAVKRA